MVTNRLYESKISTNYSTGYHWVSNLQTFQQFQSQWHSCKVLSFAAARTHHKQLIPPFWSHFGGRNKTSVNASILLPPPGMAERGRGRNVCMTPLGACKRLYFIPFQLYHCSEQWALFIHSYPFHIHTLTFTFQ